MSRSAGRPTFVPTTQPRPGAQRTGTEMAEAALWSYLVMVLEFQISDNVHGSHSIVLPTFPKCLKTITKHPSLVDSTETRRGHSRRPFAVPFHGRVFIDPQLPFHLFTEE